MVQQQLLNDGDVMLQLGKFAHLIFMPFQENLIPILVLKFSGGEIYNPKFQECALQSETFNVPCNCGSHNNYAFGFHKLP